jgi:hypothetical protein
VTDVTDFAANPIAVTAGTQGAPIALGGLSTVSNAVDPFTMEDADGLPTGWGQLSAGGVSQTSRISNLVLDLEFRTPYSSRVQSSNVASHIVRSMVQSATGNAMTGALGTPSTKVVVLIASDVNVCGFAGLSISTGFCLDISRTSVVRAALSCSNSASLRVAASISFGRHTSGRLWTNCVIKGL